MYNCTKHHTGSAVARITKDSTARPQLPPTVENLLDREEGDRPEIRTTLVAMEHAKYNINIAALCETRFSESGSLNDMEYSCFWSGKPEEERREAGVGFAIKKISSQS